ncbi:MAG TPA: hypothetical protein VMV56_09195 [Williamwhitmania sp.]|nr:hypothetical protein [Williamwhitmania sp.]
MKRTAFVVLLLMIAISAFSQTEFVAYNGIGKVILNTGDTIQGVVDYKICYPGSVRVTPDGEKKREFHDNDTKEFFVKGRHYYSVNSSGQIGSSSMFVYLLNSETSKIKLFMYEQQPIVVTNNDFTATTDYYILLPGETNVISLGDLKLMPFNKKMSKFVESCPVLAKKILDKEDGYKVGMLTTPMAKIEILKKIAAEFDACQQ